MKRFFALSILMMMTAGLSLAGDLVGYVTDEKCANAGKSGEAHASCAQTCVKGGEAIVFVNEADKKVYKIANQDKLKDHVGHKVTLTGKIDGGTINVDTVKM